MFFTTEITSKKSRSDRVLYHRTTKAYSLVSASLKGKVLEIGCGEGYGIEWLQSSTLDYTGVDKNPLVLSNLRKKYPDLSFIEHTAPRLEIFENQSFDTIICFQFVEHIEDYPLLVTELLRIVKSDGIIFLTTPNKKFTLIRNPWHFVEFDAIELKNLLNTFQCTYDLRGINGSVRAMHYFEQNFDRNKALLRWDIFDFQRKLPSNIYKCLYEIGNRINRYILGFSNKKILNEITLEDYTLGSVNPLTLDFFVSICPTSKKKN